MPNSRRHDPPKEDCQQLDIVMINEKISRVSDDIDSFVEAQDKRFDQLEEGLDTRFAEMTKKLIDAISGKRQERRREGHGQKKRKKSENVDEESDEEGDSKGEMVPTDSEKEPAEEHISTGKDKKEDKESKNGKEMEEEEEDKEEIKGMEKNWEKDEGKKVNVTKEELAAKPKKEEKKEAKASTSNADKEKKKPAAQNIGKEKVSEEVKGPTDDELTAAICKIHARHDFDLMSKAQILWELECKFKVDFTGDRKEEVNKLIENWMTIGRGSADYTGNE